MNRFHNAVLNNDSASVRAQKAVLAMTGFIPDNVTLLGEIQANVGGRPQIEQTKTTLIERLLGQGHSVRYIANAVPCAHSTIYKLINKNR